MNLFTKLSGRLVFLIWIFFYLGNNFSDAQTTYIWIGASGGSWAVSTNWSPARAAPAANDVILFNSGTTLNVTAVPTQTIRSLTITSSSNITLTGVGGAIVLSINGPTLTNNLVIDAGSTLQLTGTTTSFTLRYLTAGTANQRGQIDGTLRINPLGLFTTNTIATTVVTVGSGGTIINANTSGGTTPITGTTATLQFASGSNYNHITTTQLAVPTATYDVNSTANFTAGTSNINNMTQTFGNVTVNSAGTLTLVSGSPTINGTLTLTAGILAIGSGSLTLNGTFASSGTGTFSLTGGITIGGSGDCGTLRFNSAPTLTSFTMNRASSGTVGITQALTIGASGTLNLTNGIINSGGNLISVTNGAAASVTNTGGTASYVNGALQRTLNANLSAVTIIFPIGKTSCQKVTFNGLSTTSSASAAVVRVETFDAGSGGTYDPSLTAINTDNYWSASIIANPTSLYDPGTISLVDAAPVPDATNAIAYSSTLAGTYFSLGGSTSAPTITSILTVPVTLGYFVLGTKNSSALCGTYSVGSTGNFQSLTDAVNSLNVRPISCNVIFELEASYTGAGERYPVNFFYSGTSSATATFRPVSGSGTLTTSGDPGSYFPLINLNGADYIIFDGRAGGAGTTISWIIKNTRTASTVGPAIQLKDGANNITLEYLNVQSSNSQSTSGTVLLTAPSITNTNSIIQNCDIGSNGSTYQLNAICAYATYPFQNNFVQVLNNQIHDFVSYGTATASGVIVTGTGTFEDYGNNWTISGNSLFRSVKNILTDYLIVGINFVPCPSSSGLSTGNTISNNTIGGSAAVTGGISPSGTWVSTATGSNRESFTGILLEAKSATISGNYIGSFLDLYYSGFAAFTGIDVLIGCSGGTVAVSDNTIGNSCGAGNRYYTTSTTNTAMVTSGNFTITVGTGLPYQVDDVVIISNMGLHVNYVYYMLGPITAYNSGTGSLTINVTQYLGTGTASSWHVTLANGVTTAGQFHDAGIWAGGHGSTNGSIATCNITNNTVSNLFNLNTNNAEMAGILTQNGGPVTITGNTIYNITTRQLNTTSQMYLDIYGCIAGISQQSIYSGVMHTVSNNEVYNLYSNDATASANAIYGIELNGVQSAGITHIADGNIVHGISTTNSATLAVHYGIYLRSGTQKLTNNIIILGIRADGTSITGSVQLNGIFDGENGNSTYTEKFYHNSIFIGGTGVASGTVNTYSFRRNNTLASPKDVVDVRNNIFVNNRSNASGTGKHFSIGYENNTQLNTSTEDYNDYYGNGTGYVLAQVGGADQTTLAAIRTSTGNANFDLNSMQNDPLYQSPTTAFPDLHITTGSPAINTGTNAGVAVDFDNEARSSPDIGADEYNAGYTPSGTTIISCGNGAPMPIELLFFNGSRKDEKSFLHWSTASEINNDYFTLERSTDAEIFVDIGKMKGAGNSPDLRNYSFVDDLSHIFGFSSQIFYYRLKQTDFDGKFSYSKIIALSNSEKENDFVRIFPNPVSNVLSVYINGRGDFDSNIRMTDVFGREVVNKEYFFNKESNVIQVDMSALNSGIYFLMVTAKGENSAETILKKIVKTGE